MAKDRVGTNKAWAGRAAIIQVHKGSQEQEEVIEVQRSEGACANTIGDEWQRQRLGKVEGD